MNPKVLMVTGQYYPEINGAANQCKNIVEFLQDKVDFQVVTSAPKTPIFGDQDVRVKRILNFNSIFSTITTLVRYLIIIIRERFDIVHFHGYSRKTTPLAILSKLTGSKIVLKLTSYGVDDIESIRSRGALHSHALAVYDRFFCPSAAFITNLADHGGKSVKSRCLSVHNGVNLKKFFGVEASRKSSLRECLKISKDAFVIVLIAHLSRDKGITDILDAASYLNSVDSRVIILIIGSKDPLTYEVSPELVAQFSTFSSNDSLQNVDIRLLGQVNNIEMYLQSSDLFVLTSRREGSPNSLLEAMACAIPCIASRLPGITDVIIQDRINGLLYEPGDVFSLVNLIKLIKNNISIGQCLVANGRKTISDTYNMEKISVDILNHYLSLQAK